MPPKKSELPGSPKIQELDEEEVDESPLLPMTPESKQLAAVIATAVATAMAGKSAPPDSSSSMVRYSAGVSLASRTRSIISIVRNLKLHLVTLPGANLASNELRLFSSTACPLVLGSLHITEFYMIFPDLLEQPCLASGSGWRRGR